MNPRDSMQPLGLKTKLSPEEKHRRRIESSRRWYSKPENREKHLKHMREIRKNPWQKEKEHVYYSDNKDKWKNQQEKIKNNPLLNEKNSKRSLIIYRQRRQILLEKMGGVCVCCNENDIDVLVLDHKNNDGHLERKEFKRNKHSDRLAQYNKDPIGFMELFQVLCANCNLKKLIYFNEFKRLEKWGLNGFA